ncbi:hypothetical protein [Sphingobacterium suaedae]|uniref:Uncharacterized protein n=1 Tax=Sphingobacterium suaedae TaxID=1686402 RepID=A0ABW5KBK0_9SPHI
MRKDKSTELLDNYWNGISSVEEERQLKKQKNEAYFQALKDSRNERMEWSFDEFLRTASQGDKHLQRTENRHIIRVWSCCAAAVVLVVIGAVYLYNYQTEMLGDDAGKEKISLVQKATRRSPDRNIEQPSQITGEWDNPDSGADRVLPINRSKKREVAATSDKNKALLPDALPDEKEVFVVVNGKPIYNQKEAEGITIASLKLMVNNIQEGKEALEKVKYIKVSL